MLKNERHNEALERLVEARNKEIAFLKETIDQLKKRIEALVIELEMAQTKITDLQVHEIE